MREEGLQAREAYKEVLRASRRLALEALKSSKDVHPSKGQKVPLHFQAKFEDEFSIYFISVNKML